MATKATKQLIKPLWTPAKLPNIELWLDAADLNTFSATGGLIDEWRDKSGKQRHCSSTGSFRPTLSFNSINGRSSVLFSSAQYLDNITGRFPLITRAIFAVFRENTSGVNVGMFSVKPVTLSDFNSPNGSVMSPADKSTNRQILSFGVGNPIAGGVVSIVTEACPLAVYQEVKTLARADFFVNSLPLAIFSEGDLGFNPVSPNGYLLGARYVNGAILTSSNFLDGNICEILYLGYIPDLNTISKIQGYLANKWGISLPTTQAYYNRKAR